MDASLLPSGLPGPVRIIQEDCPGAEVQLNEHDRRFNRGDLLHAWLEERKYRNAHENLRDYHGRAAKAYGTAFGIDLDHPPGGDAGDDALLVLSIAGLGLGLRTGRQP